MTNPLRGYGAGIRKETLLGWVAWYGVSEPEVKYDALKAQVEALGLDEESLPGPIRPGDAFKRACRYAQASKLYLGPDRYGNVLIRKVSQENDVLEWHMIVETVDPEGNNLSYDRAARLIFHKASYTVTAVGVDKRGNPVNEENEFLRKDDAIAYRTELEQDPDYPDLTIKMALVPQEKLTIDRSPWSFQQPQKTIVDEAVVTFEREFENAMQFLDAQTIRQMVRRQMDLMRSFRLRRNGSVYFIPKDQEEKAVGMCSLLDWMGNGSGFHILPLIDTEKQREMIQAAFEDEVHESAQTMIGAMQEALAAKESVTFSQWSKYLEEKDKLLDRAREYSDLIDREFIKAGTELALLDDAMAAMLKEGLIKSERRTK